MKVTDSVGNLYTDRTDIGPETYDAYYFGMADPPRANYRGYGPDQTPHWAQPLAVWLSSQTQGPVLDVGCAYGFLCRELQRLGLPAYGVEWSPYAAARRVAATVTCADARTLNALYAPETFAAVVSMDFLEHLPPDDCRSVCAQMASVLRPGGLMVHLVGAHEAGGDLAHHLSDPTHQTSEPLSWYRDAFVAHGMTPDPETEAALNQHPAWRDTDWNGRWLSVRKAA